MKQLIAELAPYRSGVVCDGLDRVTDRLCQELPFTVHEFESGTQCNGWTVPDKWECQKAQIWKQHGGGEVELIYDGNAHALGVCSYSNSFVAGIGGEELLKHLYYADAYDDALIYHCDWWYKPWARDWGFSVTKNLYRSIDPKAAYHVELRTTFEPGNMKVLEYVLPGETEQSVVINAHNCHPGCANDDLSGCAVGIEVMKALRDRPNRRLTYRLIIGPEHFHSIFYLDRFGKNGIEHGIFLESLGTSGALAHQHAFYNQQGIGSNHVIDDCIEHALEQSGHECRSDEFRKIVGNDETCWSAAGYDIPCVSLSRVPFKQYHTCKDNADLMDEYSLLDAVEVVTDAMLILDANRKYKRLFTGLVCLSNPAIDLYKPMLDPSIPDRRTITHEQRHWNYMMDCLPMELDLNDTMTISRRHSLPFWDVHNYIQQWKAKGLVE